MGRITSTKEDKLAAQRVWQREYRIKNNNLCTKRYEKTKKGKLVRSYRNMQSRVCGIVKTKVHLYGGLDLLDRETFYAWSLSDPSFNTLFDAWEKSGYNKKLSPSIDRIETSIGYVLGNIRWITHSENSRLGAISRFNK